jgi:hypothetical protein
MIPRRIYTDLLVRPHSGGHCFSGTSSMRGWYSRRDSCSLGVVVALAVLCRDPSLAAVQSAIENDGASLPVVAESTVQAAPATSSPARNVRENRSGRIARGAPSDGTPRARPANNDAATRSIVLHKVRGLATGGAVVDVAAPGAFDSAWVTCPTIVKRSSVYTMWFSSFYDWEQGRGGIGMATSRDKVHWRRSDSPVLVPEGGESLDAAQVLGPEVLFDGERYLMWYTGMPHARHASGFGFYRIFLATSKDGAQWRRAGDGRPVIDLGRAGSADEVQAATPSVLQDENGYRMWYAAWSPARGHTICVARSKNGIDWARENEGRPVEGLTPAGAYGPAVARQGDELLLLYMATDGKPGLYLATSHDGIAWSTLNRHEPVLPPGMPGSFDDVRAGHPFLHTEGNQIEVWYTGYQRDPGGVNGWKLRIGRAMGILPDPFGRAGPDE